MPSKPILLLVAICYPFTGVQARNSSTFMGEVLNFPSFSLSHSNYTTASLEKSLNCGFENDHQSMILNRFTARNKSDLIQMKLINSELNIL